MRVLAVRQPWASLIINGYKSIEVRSMNTELRGKVAIYASKTPPRKEDIAQMNRLFDNYYMQPLPDELKNLPRGKILGYARIWASEGNIKRIKWNDLCTVHCAPDSYYSSKTHFWYLNSIEKLEEPIDYQMPQGCVVWANA